MPQYLTVADILELHQRQITRFGGSFGLRDLGQLKSALYRPQTGHYPDIISEAAALWESLSQNHPFVDGDKRTALAGMLSFLLVNGFDIAIEADELWDFLSGLYESHAFKYEAIQPWLRQHAIEQGAL